MNRFSSKLLSLGVLAVVGILVQGCEVAEVTVPSPCTPERGCPDADTGNDNEPTDPLPGRDEPLSAFISSERPILIRGDLEEGGAVIQVTASKAANFEWTIEIDGIDDPSQFLEFCEGPSAGCAPPAGSLDPFSAYLRIVRILRDPGATGTRATIRVRVTAIDGSGEVLQQAATLDLLRRETELAVSLTPDNSRVSPDAELGINASISGGRVFVYGNEDGQANPCNGVFPTSVSNSVIVLLPESGSTVGAAERAPYCISWRAASDGLSLPAESLGLEPIGDNGEFFRVNNDGETEIRLLFHAPVDTGEVVFNLTVSDQRGSRATDSVTIPVASAEQIVFAEFSAATTQLAPGDSVDLTAVATGGEPPYQVEFELVGAAIGRLTSSSCTTIGGGQPCIGTYVAPDNQVGPVLVRATVRDSVGANTTEVVQLTVAPPQELTVTLSSSRDGLRPLGTTQLDAAVIGGTPPYDICYTSNIGTLTVEGDDACDGIGVDIGGNVTNVDLCSCNVGNAASRGTALVIDDQSFTAPLPQGVANIRVAVRDAVGVTVTDAITLNVSTDVVDPGGGGGGVGPVDVVLSGNTVVCVGESVLLTALASGGTGTNTFTFSVVSGVGGGLSGVNNTRSFTPAGPGTTTIRVVVSEIGGGTAEDTIEVQSVAAPTANAGPDRAMCLNQTDQVIGGTGGNPTGGGGSGAYTFAWTMMPDTVGTLDSATVANPIFNPTDTGDVTLCVTVTDTNGCVSSQDCMDLTVNPLPSPAAKAGNSAQDGFSCDSQDDPPMGFICEGETIQLFACPDDQASYMWTGPLFNSTEQAPFVTPPLVEGDEPFFNVDYEVTISNIVGCSEIATTRIQVFNTPVTSIFTPDEVCENATDVSASVPDISGASYFWTVTNGDITAGQGTHEITFDVGSDPVTVEVMVESAQSCSGMGSAVISIDANPTATIATPATVCVGQTGVSASVPIAGAGAQYIWDIDGGDILAGQDSASILYNATSPAGGTITVNVTIDDGGCITEGSTEVHVLDVMMECLDGNECTSIACSAGACTYPPLAPGTACGDDTDDQCTSPDTCNGAGVCLDNHVDNGTACDDGVFCNENEACEDGVCTGGEAVVCDDGLDCTTDSCNEELGDCEFVQDVQTTCLIDGECVDEGELNPLNDCEICSPLNNPVDWTNVLSGTACGDPSETECSAPDTCDGEGFCQPNDAGEGSACGDETIDECTAADSCDGFGNCQANDEPAGTACGDDTSDECTAPDTCDGAGACLDNHSPDATTCDDGDICTDGDACMAGSCIGDPIEVELDCSDGEDNDCDEAVDCDDSDCALAPECL